MNFKLNIFNRVSFTEKFLFTKHLSVLIKSGIPLVESLETITAQTKNSYFRKVLRRVSADIANGQTLDEAFSKFPHVFDPLFINMIRIGEESGNLEENLRYLAEEQKKNYEFKQKIVAASLYPVIVFATAIIVGGGVSLFVLPKIIELFNSLNAKLPLSTKILLWIATVMRDYGIFIFAGLFILLILFRLVIQIPKYRFIWHKFLLSLPVMGAFYQNVQLTIFSRNMGIMLKSGLTIDKALAAQKVATTNLVYRRYVAVLEKEVQRGQNLEEILSNKSFRYFPLIASKMIGVGERTGKLDESLLYLADYFEEEVDNATKNFSNVLEPALLLFIGLIVAFVAMSIIAPIYDFTSSVQK